MNAKTNKLVNAMNSFASKMSANPYVKSISGGMMQALPFIMVGSIASLISGLPIAALQSFLAATGLGTVLTWTVNITTNILGILVAFFVASSLAEVLEVKAKIIGFLSVCSYLLLLASTNVEKNVYLSFDYTGSKGIIVAFFVAFITVKLFKSVTDKNFTIKMPEGTPEFVSNSFLSLIPVFCVFIFYIIVKLVFAITPFGNAFDAIYHIIQVPLSSIIGENIFVNILLNVIAQLLWVFGIHGSSIIDSMRGPILFALDGAQQAAYANGQTLPNIMGMAFSYMYYTAVMYPAMAIALLIFSKSKRYRTLAKLALPASFFGISEPLAFGLPVILNPILAIPFIIIPSIAMFIAYGVTSMGIVSAPIGVQVFNIPLVINGLMNGSVSIAILQIILLILSVVLWAPFIKIADSRILKEELSENKEV